ARRSQPLPKALTLDEVMALLDAPDTTTPAGRRDRAILEFLYATGARVSEAVGLDLEDVELDSGTAIVTGKGDKQRLVPLGSYSIRAIEAYLPDRMTLRVPGRDSGALFLNARGGRLTRQGLWGIVRKTASRAGIPADRVSPHVLRHSAATHMVERGADLRSVQQLLGHATITTTQVYTRVTPQHLLEVYVTSHPRSR
ncbi:MAG: tyrosine-type recombinase/integrase, partial [Acidimicrobiia bacterium]